MHLSRTGNTPQAISLRLPGIVLCLSQKGTLFFPVCNIVLDVHVKQYDMCISDCFTCTSKTMLHTEASYVTLREGASSIPEKETDDPVEAVVPW